MRKKRTENPPVTVIVPIWGVEKYIEKCAQSLFSQTLSNIEYIFVDDCTPDRSVLILEDVISRYPLLDVVLIRQKKNSGVFASRRVGINSAHGEYIAFCDSDDWVEHDMYEKMYNEAKSQKADIIACGYVEHKEMRETSFVYSQEADSQEQIFSFQCFGGIYGSLCNKLIRREFLHDNMVFLGEGLSMWEDSCFILPLRLRSKKSFFMKNCFYHYNVNSDSITTRFSMKKVFDSIEATRRLEFFLKKAGRENESQNLISNLKIASKEVLLKYPSTENVYRFRTTFPETKGALWSYPNWNMLLKLRAWLVIALPLKLAVWVLKYMRK